jgi:chromosome segregation ATPase
MSSRSLPPPPAAQTADLENTAELPVLDPPPAHDADDAHTSTDTWASLPQLHPEHERQLQTQLEAISAELRSAQQLLHNKSDRLAELEREREEARAAGLAAQERFGELTATLARLQSSAAQQTAQISELTQARQSAEQYAAGLAAELAHLRAGGDAASSEMAQLRTAAEQRAAHLDAELTRLRTAATQHAAQFNELTQARSGAEERVRALDADLKGVRTELTAVSERAAQAEQRLQEQARAAEAGRARELQMEQARAVREQAHATHTAGVMADLHAERARAMAYFESLQSVHVRRTLFEDLVVDLQAEAQVREGDVARLARELAAREARLREQDAELAQRAARIAALEQDVASFGSALAERDVQLRDGRREAAGQFNNIARLQAQLEASGERVRALSAVAEQHNTTESQRKSELSRLLAERVTLTTAVEAAHASASAAAAQAAEQEAELNQRRARGMETEAALSAERKRAKQLEEELATVRREMDEWGETLKSVQQERSSYQTTLAAAEERAAQAERLAAERGAHLIAVQGEADSHATRVRGLEEDLAAAEEALLRLESESRKSGARLEELEKAHQQWRATLEEVRPAATDSTANQALRDAVRHSDELAPPDIAPLPDGATRLLIFSQDGREVVHVLGRKTSVGRTPDNDLQIDAKFISRHHAVILAGPTQTIIEDLNSTNGVHVNGRRVTRQQLEDGDTVSIGRQQYRFVVRKNNDKR